VEGGGLGIKTQTLLQTWKHQIQRKKRGGGWNNNDHGTLQESLRNVQAEKKRDPRTQLKRAYTSSSRMKGREKKGSFAIRIKETPSAPAELKSQRGKGYGKQDRETAGSCRKPYRLVKGTQKKA